MEKHMRIAEFFKDKELTEMYASIGLRSFAMAIIGIFIPLLLLEFSYSIYEVLIFYTLLSVFIFAAFLLASFMMDVVGIKHTMIFSAPLTLVFYGMMYTVGDFQWSIYLLALVAGLQAGLFWFGFHIEFAKHTSSKNRGSQVGILHALTLTLGILGPIFGGFIIEYASPQWILVVSSTMLSISVIPLMFTKDEKFHVTVHWKKIIYGDGPKVQAAFFCEGFRSHVALLMWPLFIFYMGASFLVIGTIYTIVRILNTITNLVVGKWCDSQPAQKVLRIGSIFHGATMAVRGFVATTAPALTAMTSIGGVSFVLMHTPYSKLMYDRAHKGGAEMILRREFYLEVGRATSTLAALILVFMLGNFIIAAIVLFIFGAVAAVGHNLIAGNNDLV